MKESLSILETPNDDHVASSASSSPKSVLSKDSHMSTCKSISAPIVNKCQSIPKLNSEWKKEFSNFGDPVIMRPNNRTSVKGLSHLNDESTSGSAWLDKSRNVCWEDLDESIQEKSIREIYSRRDDGYSSTMDCTESGVSTFTSLKTILRVRIINQASKLHKDLLVNIRDDTNLFEAIYDNKAVKKANIRKWGKSVTQQVKNGSHEIRCSIWDDDVNSPSHTYSIEDLKRKSTKELYYQVGPEIDLIKLVLHCAEKTIMPITAHPTSSSDSRGNSVSGSSRLSSVRSSLCTSSTDEQHVTTIHQPDVASGSQKSASKRRPCARFNHPPISSEDTPSGGTFRCPFSGLAVDESIFRQFGDRENTQKNRRNLTKPGPQSSPPAATCSSEVDDNSTIRTETLLGSSDMYSITQSIITTESTMRIRITNELSQRHKDLVVDIKPDLFVYESIYEHKGVKSALVRRWKPDVVEGVKKKTKEIQCVLLDGKDGNISETYSLEELKKISTKDLFDHVPKSDPIQLVLRCIEKKVERERTTAYAMTNDPIKALLELRKSTSVRGAPEKPSGNEKLKSGSETSLRSMGRRTSRPNHMNLSGAGNSTFSTMTNLATRNSSCSLSSKAKARVIGSNLQHIPEPKTTNTPFPYEKNKTKGDSDVGRSSSRESLKKGISNGLARGVEFINLSFHSTQSCQSAPLHDGKKPLSDVHRRASACEPNTPFQGKLSEFKRLYNSKKGIEFQSGDNFMKLARGSNRQFVPSAGVKNATFSLSSRPSIDSSMNTRTRKSLNFQQQPSMQPQVQKSDVPQRQPNDQVPNWQHQTQEKPQVSKPRINGLKESDRISRFLKFGANRKIPGQRERDSSASSTKVMDGTTHENTSQRDGLSVCSSKPGTPPVKEIAVVKGRAGLASALPSISLSGDLVKEVFPYHVVIDQDFRIIQIGNSLSQLMEGRELLGQRVSDIFTITGPIPSFGKAWKWATLEKMKKNSIFLEGIEENSSNQKPKIKGSIIEISPAPKKQVLLSLSPNVKNLSELESMNLSMQDLPIHSCQRDAVLLGEHSKSEVKLTNHLDLLHRELIDSMEKQIEDRTNELATANRNLELANAQLASQKAKQLEHFACMSHEIRTPLNCIVGMSSLLLEDSEGPSMDPMHADSIRMINTSGDLLKAVVDDVLDYAKLESGSFEVDIKSSRLQDTIDSVLYSISQKVKEKNIRLRAHFTPTVPEYLETDSRRLQQVLFNLLGNAGKFSKQNSVIDLSVSVVQDQTHENGKRDLIRFSVRDYGKGIDKKDFETIFQPFSQASKETQNIYGGTGLGLSITSKLVNRLGGTVSLDSQLDKYADFTVDLPMNAKYVQVEKISNALKDTTIVVIEPKQADDKAVSQSFPFKTEPMALDKSVAEVYGLNVLRCNVLEELIGKVPKQKGDEQEKHFTLLVHETLYQHCSTEMLEKVFGRSHRVMITYGENFMIEETKTSHLKTITGLFPATLLQSIAKQVSLQKPVSKDSLTKVPSKEEEETTVVEAKASKKSLHDYKHELKVLYAEDNLVNQKVLSRVLNRYGIKDITIVDNGKKAVDASAETKYDCILLDMQMPIMDGMEACEIIMARDPDTIIVFVTAHALDEIKNKAMAAGAKGFITKPFRVGDIDKVLTEIYT